MTPLNHFCIVKGNIYKALKGFEYEIELVDDGSIFNTLKQIKKYADKRARLLIFHKNYWQTTAMSAGIEVADGDFIVTMDGDLQNDPYDIPTLLQKLLAEEWDVVAGLRRNRKDGVILRKLPSKIANLIIRKVPIAVQSNNKIPKI